MGNLRIKADNGLDKNDSLGVPELKYQLEVFKAVLESIPMVIFICDEKARIQYCNDALCNLVNLTQEDIQFKKITEIFPSLQKRKKFFRSNKKTYKNYS